MNTTVNVVCYKWKVLSNGENPLMIRICKNGKKKYQSLGISVNPMHWDFKKNKPKNNCPNKEYIEKIINDTCNKFTERIVQLKSECKEFTANSLIDKTTKIVQLKTVEDVFLEQIERLTDENRRGYMLSIKQVYNSLIDFNKHLNIYFSDIDVVWLRKYETFLRKKGIAENTIGIRFRTLRAIYNMAIKENIVKAEFYPFKSYKVSKLHQDTAKRAISKEDINRILKYKPDNGYTRFTIDVFAFTYYTGGINFVDIAYLTKENIIDGRLIYKRRKTGKLIQIPLQPQALELINKYSDKNTPYLFPILSEFHKTDIQKANRIHKVITKINQRLKDIGNKLEIPIRLTTYVARHSQATVMKKAGVSTAIISQIMGHSSERVTQIYLDCFDNEQVDDAMKNLL